MSGKRTYFAGLITGVALAAIAFASCTSARSDAAERERNPRWEYTFSDARAGAEPLNKLGEQGWEAYAINPDFQVALKRAKNRLLEFPVTR
jgi:hypothetical protein